MRPANEWTEVPTMHLPGSWATVVSRLPLWLCGVSVLRGTEPEMWNLCIWDLGSVFRKRMWGLEASSGQG